MNVFDIETLASTEKERKWLIAIRAIEVYRDTMTNEDSNRAEIKSACNNALRKMLDYCDLQGEIINALIIIGKEMAMHLSGKGKKPAS